MPDASFVGMRGARIREALSADRHFSQAVNRPSFEWPWPLLGRVGALEAPCAQGVCRARATAGSASHTMRKPTL